MKVELSTYPSSQKSVDCLHCENKEFHEKCFFFEKFVKLHLYTNVPVVFQ